VEVFEPDQPWHGSLLLFAAGVIDN